MKIVDARVILTCPGRNFVTLKIVTDEGVTGVGDATLNGRELAVASYLRDHVAPLLIGRDPARIEDHWLATYAPDVLARDARRWPTLDRIADALGGEVSTTRVPIPFTCVDGFSEEY